MYIRQTSRTLADGTKARYLQLAHKVRDPETGVPRDEILYHFGRADQFDRGQLKRLATSLTRFLDPADQAEVTAAVEDLGTDLRAEASLSYGGSYLLDALWKRLQLDDTIDQLLRDRGFEMDVERHLFALVANRALDPRSKLGLERWVGRQVHIADLPAVAVQHLYRTMDFLVAHHEALQKTVYFQVASLLNLQVDLLFFDTTSTYCETEAADDPDDGLRQFGHSKDHRADRPQVVIGLAVTRDGIPVRCWVLPGNTADASLVEQVQADLAGWQLNRVVWVMDRGMAGEDQRIALQRGGGHDIFGEQLRAPSKPVAQLLGQRGRYQDTDDGLRLKSAIIAQGSEQRQYVLVYHPDRATKDRETRQQILDRLEEQLTAVNKQVRQNTRGHTKRVCQLTSHPYYGRFLRELQTGELRIDQSAVRAEAHLDGKTVLSTSDLSLAPAEVVQGYKQLAEVEAAFKTLKHTLDVRPMFHRRADRIQAHVLVCWLALLLIRLVEVETDQTWDRLRDDLAPLSLVRLRNASGTVTLRTELTEAQRDLFTALNIPPPKRMHETQPQST